MPRLHVRLADVEERAHVVGHVGVVRFHPAQVTHGLAGRVVLVPAGPGTGIIAGAAVRSVCEAAGITNILTKSFGTNNPLSLVKATFHALSELRTLQDIERLRGVPLS